MARREWAEKEVTKRLSDGWSGDALVMGRNEAMDMLIKQHARAVRIVKRLQKNAERGGFGLAYGVALKDVLTALTKGRA